jgi:putative hydrolase of the HAD superfamily
MIIVFDLDDTLYDESTFVRSGFLAVAAVLQAEHGIPREEAIAVLWNSFLTTGRGKQLDEVLMHFGIFTRKRLNRMLVIYRHHRPNIKLFPGVKSVLVALGGFPLYLVTDGHKGVQNSKIAALGIRKFFRHCYITNRYGLRFQKPSPHVFQLLCTREQCLPADVVYVGDDPSKDFCGIRPLGFRTIRVMTGRHSGMHVPHNMDAEFRVGDLSEMVPLVSMWPSGI